MWTRGFKVRRPARSAVWSPKNFATHPWDTSWQMMEGMMTQNKMISCCEMLWCKTRAMKMTAPARIHSIALGPRIHGSAARRRPARCAHLLLGGVDNAKARGGHGFEPGLADGLGADFADAIGARFEAPQGGVDLFEGVLELSRQPLGFAALGGDLGRVGEVRV